MCVYPQSMYVCMCVYPKSMYVCMSDFRVFMYVATFMYIIFYVYRVSNFMFLGPSFFIMIPFVKVADFTAGDVMRGHGHFWWIYPPGVFDVRSYTLEGQIQFVYTVV